MLGVHDPGEFSQYGYGGLFLLDDGFNQINFTTNMVTRWMGEMGASYIMASVGYNGWAARHSLPVQVESADGRLASCYKPLYALGFLPLVLSATVLLVSAVVMLLRSSLLGSEPLKDAYGGLGPYINVVCPGAPPKTTVLELENEPLLRFRVVSDDTEDSSDSTSETPTPAPDAPQQTSPSE